MTMCTALKLSILWIIISLNLTNQNHGECSRILGIFPYSAKSHYIMYEPLLLELAKRGHQVVSINAFPQKTKVENLTDISTIGYVPRLVDDIDFRHYNSLPRTILVKLGFISHGLNETVRIYDVPEVLKMIKSDQSHFDLVIIELFNNDLHLSLAEKLRAPFLSISPCPLMPWANSRIANPDNPSYIPHTLGESSSRMNFFQRFSNTITLLVSKVMYDLYYDQESERMVSRTFQGQRSSLRELAKKTSLILVNTHVSLHGARPLVPGVVEVGGIHVTSAASLPQELQTFIDGAEYGVIYFCMGSMLRASTIPDEKRDALVRTFARLRQKVLWKWEDDTMPGKSDNVKLVKWMPQRDILAHPNVKLFISHGGLLGTTEAVHCGVPIIGIPFYGDQAGNIEAVASHGAGLRLDYNDINEQNLYDKITEILNNPQYAENAKSLSERFRDRPQTPLETAVYWTEYVIRHKGAPHLRSAAVDLTWYQYLLIDVIAFITFVFATATLIIYYSLKFVLSRLFRRNQKSKKASQTKAKKS